MGEEVKERKMKRGGRMMTETIRTEEREVYESNDSETSDDEADHDVVEYEHLETEEPREYKTKTEESFIEYFQRGSSGDRMRMVKVGSGPHYRTEQNHFSKNINSRKPLKQSRSWDNDTQDNLRSSSLSSHHTTSLNDLNKQGADRVLIAKVIDETPTVTLRNKKKEDINRYIEHRQSANFSSLGAPIRSSTPVHNSSRCSTPTSKEYHFRNCRVKERVTRKNVEKTVKRQLVLEDGRILDEDEPIVTVDTTENKEIFETDADEERDNGYRTGAGDMNIGDRVTTLRTVKDVRENVMKTEAAENVGIIADRDIAGVMRDKKSLGRVLRRGEESRELRSVKTVPVVVENSRNHSTVTNTEEVKERKMKRGGRMMTETIRTEEREVYESNDSETSDDEADHDVVEYEHLETEEPREYKTKTEESFIEY